MNRRGFLGALGAAGAAAVAAPVLSLNTVQAVEASATPAKGLQEVKRLPEGAVHFAVLMDIHGRPCHTMMVENLPQEIHITSTADPTRKPAKFKLVSKDRYDGRTIPGLARYILWEGICPWSPMRLGF